MNNSYILSGSKFYKIVNVFENIISVVPESKSMTRKLAKKTYPAYHLEALGYIIEGVAP